MRRAPSWSFAVALALFGCPRPVEAPSPAASEARETPVVEPAAERAASTATEARPGPRRRSRGEGRAASTAIEARRASPGGLRPHELEYRTGAAGADAPLVVLLHGLGDSPSGIAPLLRDLDAPARVIAPAAPTPRGSGFSWFDIRARDGRVEVLSQALAEAADALGERLEALAAARGAEEVVVIGFSQGGMLAFALAVRRPELVRAAVPIGGLLPPPLWPDRAPSDAPLIRAFHGEADRVVPFEAAEATASALAEAGYDARLETEPGLGHGISRRLRARARAALEALLSGASGG